MGRWIGVTLLLVMIVSATARAQIPVIDPENLAQAILIAERTWQHYQQLRQEYETVVRMASGLGNMDKFRVPAIKVTRHDPALWEYGRPWIEGLNNGDPSGAAYAATTVPLQPPNEELGRLSAAARRAFERQYATVEITDTVAMRGGHQVALVRGYHERLQAAIQGLESDILNGSSRYHEMTADLDKISAGELLARRQDMATNELLSHALEQLLVRSKRLRDTEAATINMQLTTWRDAAAANAAFAAGTGDALRAWRQP
jgi:hypothetical protein